MVATYSGLPESRYRQQLGRCKATIYVPLNTARPRKYFYSHGVILLIFVRSKLNGCCLIWQTPSPSCTHSSDTFLCIIYPTLANPFPPSTIHSNRLSLDATAMSCMPNAGITVLARRTLICLNMLYLERAELRSFRQGPR